MNLFYKIHLQAFNVISIVLYHSSPTFGQVLYSCQDAFVVVASHYSGHLIRNLLNASEAFPTEWFFSIFGTRQSLVGSCQDCTEGGEALAIHTFPKFPILHLRHEAALYRAWLQSVSSSISRLRFAETDHVACDISHDVLCWSLAHNYCENQNDCIILLATQAQCAELLKWPT
jgi:hypothetical protein